MLASSIANASAKLIGIKEVYFNLIDNNILKYSHFSAEDASAAELFVAAVDSAAVYVNASTRFTDGGEFGKGCEIGISTQKLHARGPMGLTELCSYKYVITGCGQIR